MQGRIVGGLMMAFGGCLLLGAAIPNPLNGRLLFLIGEYFPRHWLADAEKSRRKKVRSRKTPSVQRCFVNFLSEPV